MILLPVETRRTHGFAELVHTLTFDAFGTILDLGSNHAAPLDEFLKSSGSASSRLPHQFQVLGIVLDDQDQLICHDGPVT